MAHEDPWLTKLTKESALAETVLRRRGLERSVARVTKIECEPAVAKGENYLSTITRMRLEVILANGSTTSRSLILKEVPPEESKRQLVATIGVFKAETNMYIQILKEMEGLIEEQQDKEGILWGHLLDYRPYTALLFEDLKASGFTVCRRQECLDYEHAQLVLYSLGRYHAMAKILEQRGIIHSFDFRPYSLFNDKNLINVVLHCGLKTLSNAIVETWGPAWHVIAEKLAMPLDVLEKKLLGLAHVDETQFNVLNHGDLWTNNMMFSYDWKRRPVNVRFLDFQLANYQSACADVTYFLFTSVKPEVRRQHYDSLLRTYTDSLLSSLSRMDYPGRHPTFEEMVAEMDRLAFFRLPLVTVFHAIMTAEGTDAFDLEEILASGGSRGHTTDIYVAETFKQRVGPELLELSQRGLI